MTELAPKVKTSDADLRFVALQPGSAMGGLNQPSSALAHIFFLTPPGFLQVPI